MTRESSSCPADCPGQCSLWHGWRPEASAAACPLGAPFCSAWGAAVRLPRARPALAGAIDAEIRPHPAAVAALGAEASGLRPLSDESPVFRFASSAAAAKCGA